MERALDSALQDSKRFTTFNRQNVTYNYEGMVAQSYSHQINGPVYGNVQFGDIQSRDQHIRERILASLRFEGMDRYHERPLESHPGTYGWIFADEPLVVHSCETCDESGPAYERWAARRCRAQIESDKRASQSAASFQNWLRYSDEIFWVTGKAGSGKSCLMKFLAGHNRTSDVLHLWAGSDVVICEFYFWAAGGKLEQSQGRLLRSLLYQLLNFNQEMIERAVPQRWAAMERSNGHSTPWQHSELRKALQSVVEYYRGTQKLCFFIDGLDGFAGDHQDLIDDLKALNRSPDIKICVSSRPWNVFSHRLGGGSETLFLKLHELTYRDLSLYVGERLGQISIVPLPNATYIEGAYCTNLQSFILAKAQGVFLWVKLAVNGLRRGIEERDTLSELQTRLQTTPSDIEDFIQKMFDSIDPVYRKYCARVLLLLMAKFRETYSNLLLVRLWQLSQDPDNQKLASTMYDQDTILPELLDLLDQSQILVNKWCKDLVDVVRPAPNMNKSDADLALEIVYCCSSHHILFAHRTILDFARAKADDGSLD
ncbi:Putative P-loop containing nucleoside triphosphate hydrolase [Septoria linicola]|uniref:P-loop containing nucleoside triphosphate hydrolase n=1 Tax=Septoria linicola TaxID=215465 RepID=A0A9Q9AG71_9PEZI|nr:putative P-loop containing nucleoside triphosphate hydrolase [Septoria linicola]USW48844.1 Putative P-loop containing nucleoside triphosphate hydrolase [Septoria linicola]